MQIKFVAAEDRLLLRVASANDEEFQFWLTQRFVKLLYPALREALSRAPNVQTQSSPAAKREVLDFEHQRAVAQTDFATAYRESPKTYPLGEQPILITKSQLRPQSDGNLIVALAPDEGQGIDLNLNHHLQHSFAKLISDAAVVAEWELPIQTLQDQIVRETDNVTVN